ncbi:MAG: TonB family protein, partial [Planctomycetota bacterium]
SGDLRGAESAYGVASLLEPEDREWKVGLLRALTEQGHHADALTIIGRMLVARPLDVELLDLQARSHIALGQHEAAADALARLEAHPAATTRARLLRAELEAETGRYAQATATYVAALEADPKGARDATWTAARLLQSKGADREASLLYALLEANESTGDVQLVFTVSRQGDVYFGRRSIGVTGVSSLVRRHLAMGETVASIRSSRGAPTEVVQRVVGEALRAGAREVSVVAGNTSITSTLRGSPVSGRRASELIREMASGLRPPSRSAPKAVDRPAPKLTAALRAKGPGAVTVLLIVDEKGDVIEARVQSSTDSAFEEPALEAVRRWRFAPARLDGEPIRARFRQTLTFPGADE